MAPNRVHRHRFEALCRMLAARADMLPTTHFADRPCTAARPRGSTAGAEHAVAAVATGRAGMGLGGRGTRGVSASALKFQIGARTLATIRASCWRIGLSLIRRCRVARRRCRRWRGGRRSADLAARRRGDRLAGNCGRPAALHTPLRRSRRGRGGVAGRTVGTDPSDAETQGEAAGGSERVALIDVRAYRTPADMATFHPLARRVAARPYQERLLGSALPAVLPAGEARAWLLFLGEAPIAYLWSGAQGDTLRYDYVGHDPHITRCRRAAC
ncbi:GNAT family N-acetyltransferase [Sphingomonas sp. MMS24-JH45]